MRVQRPPEPAPAVSDWSTLLDVRAGDRPQDIEGDLFGRGEDDLDEAAPGPATLADLPTFVPRRSLNTPIPETPSPPLTLRSSLNKARVRVVPFLVTASVICFLVATGLLSFLLLNNGQAHSSSPRLQALPGELRVGDTLQISGNGFVPHHVLTLTRDTHITLVDAQNRPIKPATDVRGEFQVRVFITPAWSIGVHSLRASEGDHSATTTLTIQAGLAGPPRLQLGISRLDLGTGFPGSLTHKDMTLTNAGGGQVSWSARSNVAWLSLNPSGGTFAGSALVTLTVNRANLPPQAYVGQVVFTQDGRSSSLPLYVSMTVDTTPASLVLSTASLAFAGSPIQSPAGQTITIQNNGGQTLNWTSGTTTADGANWLSVTPASGVLAANTSAVLTVNVNTLNLALGSYQGALSFSYAGGPAQQVAVNLTVNPPPLPVMHISPQHLGFSTNQGIDPSPKTFTISNTGNAPLNWTIRADANGIAYLGISPAHGSVPPGQSATVSIAPILGSASGTINSTLTVLDSDPGTPVPSQTVGISISITNQPVITPVTSHLEFDHDSTITDTSNLLIFSNSGSLPLHWVMTSSAQVPWLSFDTTAGTLAPGENTYINVRCVSGQIKAGTYTLTLTLRDSDPGTVVAPQTVTITLIVSG